MRGGGVLGSRRRRPVPAGAAAGGPDAPGRTARGDPLLERLLLRGRRRVRCRALPAAAAAPAAPAPGPRRARRGGRLGVGGRVVALGPDALDRLALGVAGLGGRRGRRGAAATAPAATATAATAAALPRSPGPGLTVAVRRCLRRASGRPRRASRSRAGPSAGRRSRPGAAAAGTSAAWAPLHRSPRRVPSAASTPSVPSVPFGSAADRVGRVLRPLGRRPLAAATALGRGRHGGGDGAARRWDSLHLRRRRLRATRRCVSGAVGRAAGWAWVTSSMLRAPSARKRHAGTPDGGTDGRWSRLDGDGPALRGIPRAGRVRCDAPDRVLRSGAPGPRRPGILRRGKRSRASSVSTPPPRAPRVGDGHICGEDSSRTERVGGAAQPNPRRRRLGQDD